jgi:hypothetical protein
MTRRVKTFAVMLRPEEERTRLKYLASHRHRDLSTAYRQIPFSCCDPVVIFDQIGGRVLHNASGVLLTFDRERVFLVTNYHVLSVFKSAITQYRGAIFAVGDNEPFDPLSRIVDESISRDIAVVDISDLEFNRRLDTWSDVGPLSAHVAQPWPPPTLQRGGSVVFGGWLERHRSQDGKRVEFVATPFVGLRVDDVTRESAILTLQRDYYVAGDGTLDHPILRETDFSGLSGSPVFEVVRSPIERAALIGIVKDHLPRQDVLRVALLDSLTTSGRFQ